MTRRFFFLFTGWSFFLRGATKGRTTFRKIKLSTQINGETKLKNALLIVDDKAVEIHAQKGEGSPVLFGDGDIKALTYSYSKHPRWKSGAGVAVAVGVFAIPLFFMKSKKHWLTIQGSENYAVLQLDKKNYLDVVAAIESVSEVAAERMVDE